MKFQQVYYVLDTEFRLLWVGGEWDEFALANSGPKARSGEVLSSSLLSHIADETTQDVMIRLVRAVTSAHEPLRIDYRCDSYTMLRRFQMTIQPMKESRVLVVHDLRHARTFERPHLPWQHDASALDNKCSFCNSVRLNGGIVWTAPEDLEAEHPAKVAYSICESCDARVTEAISALNDRRKPHGTVAGGFGPEKD